MKLLGRISTIRLGKGGYDDAMFGVSVTLSFGDGTACQDFKGYWTHYPQRAKYSEAEWEASHADAYKWLRELMAAAKVTDLAKLQGVPIEAEVEHMALRSWRVLTEVL